MPHGQLLRDLLQLRLAHVLEKVQPAQEAELVSHFNPKM
jgi:hypothetical protein